MSERIDHAAKALELLAAHPPGDAADGAWSMAISAEAQVHATLALVEQQRIANRLQVAHVDLLSEIGANLDDRVLDFAIRPYLTTDDWKSIEVPEDDEVFS